jgi:hypothetical protein
MKTLTGDSQNDYRIIPAEHLYRAVPLKAGTHHFKVYFESPAFGMGWKVTLGSFAGYMGLCG